jgi:hypothetical protein
MSKFRIEFTSPTRIEWVRIVTEWRSKIIKNKKYEIIEIVFDNEVKFSNFDPIHIVLLSCFIDELQTKGYFVRLDFKDESLRNYLFDEINLKNYWGINKIDHVESPTISDLNIWRITETGKEFYSISVHDYFKRSYFSGFDLSTLKNALNELYFNVFDHAEAHGNAFSFIRYDKEVGKIRVAICDFGKGIPQSLRKKYNNFENDCVALENSIKIGISAHSQKYNKGFGLDNVTSSLKNGDILRIVSNKAILHLEDDKLNLKVYDLPFNFNGTLIYFDIAIDSFEKEEILEDFSLFD